MTFPAAASSRTVPVTVTAAVSAMSPETTHSSKSPPAVIPVTAGVKQSLAETVPSEKPSASRNENEPVVVAASTFTSLAADVSEMPLPAPDDLNPRASAVIVPAPLMLPPNVCNRTVAVPAVMAFATDRFPVTRHTVTLSSVVAMPLDPRTVPIVSPFASR